MSQSNATEAYTSCYSIQIQRGENLPEMSIYVIIQQLIQYTLDDNKFLITYLFSRKEQLACCSDSEIVKMFDSYREMLQIYENNSHCDFVRGLAWCKDDLFSCSWDGNVIKHIVNIAD